MLAGDDEDMGTSEDLEFWELESMSPKYSGLTSLCRVQVANSTELKPFQWR